MSEEAEGAKKSPSMPIDREEMRRTIESMPGMGKFHRPMMPETHRQMNGGTPKKKSS